MKTTTMALIAFLTAVSVFGDTNDLDGLRQEFRKRCAALATETIRPGSSDALLERIQTIARDVFAEHPETLRAANMKGFDALPIATQAEMDAFKSEWAMPIDVSVEEVRAMLSQVPLPVEAARYYLQGIHPGDVVHPIFDFARSMTGVPSEVMLLQAYVPPDVKSVRAADGTHKVIIRTLWCEVKATLQMTPAGVFVPVAIEGRKTLPDPPVEGTR